MRYDLLVNHIQASGLTRYSEPFPMGGGNAVSVQLVLLSGTLSAVALQQSDDLETWQTLTPSITLPGTAPNHSIRAVLGVGAQYGRLKVESSTAVCLNAFVNTNRV